MTNSKVTNSSTAEDMNNSSVVRKSPHTHTSHHQTIGNFFVLPMTYPRCDRMVR